MGINMELMRRKLVSQSRSALVISYIVVEKHFLERIAIVCWHDPNVSIALVGLEPHRVTLISGTFSAQGCQLAPHQFHIDSHI